MAWLRSHSWQKVISIFIKSQRARNLSEIVDPTTKSFKQRPLREGSPRRNVEEKLQMLATGDTSETEVFRSQMPCREKQICLKAAPVHFRGQKKAPRQTRHCKCNTVGMCPVVYLRSPPLRWPPLLHGGRREEGHVCQMPSASILVKQFA